MAQVKVLEYLAAEVPDAFVASVHPGIVETDLMKVWDPEAIRSGTKDKSHSMPLDDGEYADFSTRLLTLDSAMIRGFFYYTDGSRSQITSAFPPLDDQPRSPIPARKIRLVQLGRGTTQSASERDPRISTADVERYRLAL